VVDHFETQVMYYLESNKVMAINCCTVVLSYKKEIKLIKFCLAQQACDPFCIFLIVFFYLHMICEQIIRAEPF